MRIRFGENGKRHRQWKFLTEATAQVIQIAQIEIELTSCWLQQEIEMLHTKENIDI